MLSFWQKVKDALRGIKVALKEEQSFRLQILASIFVVSLLFFLPLSPGQISILILAIITVLGLELANSVIERVMDIIETDHHPKIKDAKDIMAGAVIIAAFGVFIIGAVIFWPYFFDFFQKMWIGVF